MDPKKLKSLKKSFFKEGSLVFLDSKHKLIRSGDYYRCAKDSNQQCNFDEKQVRSETLERAFSRKAKKLHSDTFPAERTIKRLLRDNFWDVAFGLDDRNFGNDEIVDSTLLVMKEDVKVKGKVGKSLITDFTDTLDQERKSNYPMMLFSYSIAVVRAVSADMTEAEMGRTLALFSKKIHLTHDGKIHSIELERWVWYLLNTVIEKNQTGYLKGLKSLNIVNGDDPLHSKSLYEAAFSYGEDGFDDAIGEDLAISYGWMNMIKKAFEFALISDPKKAQEELPKLFQAIRNDVPLNAMLSALSVVK